MHKLIRRRAEVNNTFWRQTDVVKRRWSSLQPLDHRLGELRGAERAAEVLGFLAVGQRAVVGGFDPARDFTAVGITAFVAEMVEHHHRRHEQRQRIGDALTGDIGRRAVYGFENGRIVADGPRAELLTEARLSELFKTQVRIGRDENWLHSW